MVTREMVAAFPRREQDPNSYPRTEHGWESSGVPPKLSSTVEQGTCQRLPSRGRTAAALCPCGPPAGEGLPIWKRPLARKGGTGRGPSCPGLRAHGGSQWVAQRGSSEGEEQRGPSWPTVTCAAQQHGGLPRNGCQHGWFAAGFAHSRPCRSPPLRGPGAALLGSRPTSTARTHRGRASSCDWPAALLTPVTCLHCSVCTDCSHTCWAQIKVPLLALACS